MQVEVRDSVLRDEWTTVFDRFKDKIVSATRKPDGERILELDYFKELCLTSDVLGDLLGEQAKRVWTLGQRLLDEREETSSTQVHLSITNTQDSFTKELHQITSQDYGRLVKVHGIVRNVSGVRERTARKVKKCMRCDTRKQTWQPYDLPKSTRSTTDHCPQCEKKSTFELDHNRTILEDQRVIKLSPPVQTDAPNRTMAVLVHRDLAYQVQGGDEVTLLAFKDTEPNPKKNVHKPFLVAVHIRPNEERGTKETATKEDLERWKQATKEDDFEQNVINAISPHFHGYESTRKALALTLFSSPRRQGKRGDLNILLAGDPGTGKSDLLRHLHNTAPRSVSANGSSSSGVGLTAAAVQDDLTGGWTIQSGALPLASGGICLIDELDKADPDQHDDILEAAEDQQISVDKAGINTTLRAEASIVAAANPEGGRWGDEQQATIHQIDIPPPLLSRFDGIFLFQDRPDEDRDADIADAVLDAHTTPGENTNPLTRDLITRIATHCRENLDVTVPTRVRDRFKEAYLDIRGTGDKITVGPRQLESMVRFAKARARLYLREHVTRDDTEWAVNLVTGWIENAARGPQGVVDITHIEDPEKASQRELIELIRAALQELDDPEGVSTAQITREAGLEDEDRVNNLLGLMKRENEVYQPEGPGIDSWRLVS